MCCFRNTHNCICCCILHHLKFLNRFQGKPHVEHTTLVQSGNDYCMSDCEWTPDLVQHKVIAKTLLAVTPPLLLIRNCESRRTSRLHIRSVWGSAILSSTKDGIVIEPAGSQTQSYSVLSRFRPSQTPSTRIRCPQYCLICHGDRCIIRTHEHTNDTLPHGDGWLQTNHTSLIQVNANQIKTIHSWLLLSPPSYQKC